MQLKIFLRYTQYSAVQNWNDLTVGENIIYISDTGNPATLRPVAGIVPEPDWKDFSNSVGNLDKIQLTWMAQRNSDGIPTPGAFQPQKSASNQLMIEGDAYEFIKKWLIDDIAAPLNSIDVRIEDVGCGSYFEYVIKSSQIEWCEDKICQFAITIQQKDEALQCIQQTVITDNWQGWFPSDSFIPDDGKRHPRFLYCNEARPNGMMIVLWWLMSVVGAIVYGLAPIINGIIFAINSIIAIINLFGANIEYLGYFNPSGFLTPYYIKSSGCGRAHPSPLIRDYIDNVCKRCGIMIDEQTDPIFHSPTINIQTSTDRYLNIPSQVRDNPYYNACMLNAPSRRGIKLLDSTATADYWVPDNAPNTVALDMFLDQLKTVFNAEWRITTIAGQPHLYFWRKDWYTQGAALYDFTENSSDRMKILAGMCFNWSEKKQYAYMRGLYATDGSDSCSGEALSYMNDIIELGDKTNNVVFDGSLDKTTQYFGGAKFRLDGSTTDYIADACQILLNGAVFNPPILLIMADAIIPAVKEYADYVLMLDKDTCALPKIVIWDPESGYEKAKAIRNKTTFMPSINGSDNPMPEPNPYYNPTAKPWSFLHFPDTFVSGQSWTFGSNPTGKYVVQEYFGIDFYARAADLVNYPMFFQSNYRDNIYDWFHWIDDPRINPSLNLEWSVKIDLCCDELGEYKADGSPGLNVLGDGVGAALYGRVLLPIQYYGEGKITEITVSYDSEDEVGKYIELKGIT